MNSGKIYKDLIKSFNKIFNALLRKQKPQATLWSGVTADTFAQEMFPFIGAANAMVEHSPKHAFLLVLCLGDYAYGDIECGAKSCGWGDTEDPFQAIDNCLLNIIDKRMELALQFWTPKTTPERRNWSLTMTWRNTRIC
ncbi:hypothetical protein K469DRAFT_708500 [Zopfia rhizophila CBS 207.26]|uniref:Uncharacterized protein n=1 Tax=Zopfia rhizophila CBS 207.26 TaxID=1314779 RepID=A0A6A6E3M4_9PEZI|nr:hypothetical protein K469DRAFT_708500 [Zopfia rhizophila CBS 207.26]